MTGDILLTGALQEWVDTLSSECKAGVLVLQHDTLEVLHCSHMAHYILQLVTPPPFPLTTLTQHNLIEVLTERLPVDMTMEFPLRNQTLGRFHVKIRLIGHQRTEYLTVVLNPLSRIGEMNEAKDSFMRLVSHELRTPLTSIMGYLDVLQRGSKGPLTDAQQQLCRVVQTEAHGLKFLIDDILQLSQLLSGTLVLQSTTFDLVDAIYQVQDVVTPAIEAKSLALTIDIPQRPLMIRADYQKVIRMLTNLANNAVKFTPSGAIAIKAFETTRWIEIHLSDTGLGMNHMQLSNIYTQFKQSDCAGTAQIDGLGLGLTIVKKLVELHAGQIWVKSMMGAGSTFCIRLPNTTPTHV